MNYGDYESMIGQRVWKRKPTQTKAPKPFKSGRQINTVTGIINHPVLHIPAFTFAEDDSAVECRRCYVVPNVDMKFYQFWEQGSDDAQWVCLNELNDQQVAEYFAERNIVKWNRTTNPPIKWFKREMNIIRDVIERMQGRLDLYADVLKRIESEKNI